MATSGILQTQNSCHGRWSQPQNHCCRRPRPTVQGRRRIFLKTTGKEEWEYKNIPAAVYQPLSETEWQAPRYVLAAPIVPMGAMLGMPGLTISLKAWYIMAANKMASLGSLLNCIVTWSCHISESPCAILWEQTEVCQCWMRLRGQWHSTDTP